MPTTGAESLRLGAAGLVAALLLALPGCGDERTSPPVSPYVLTIRSNTFEPARLEVPAGGTVVVLNRDPWPHSVTSEAALGALVFGPVNDVSFDTGAFEETQAFTVPASAPPGTVVFFFCSQLGPAMRNEGELVVTGTAGTAR